MYHIDFERPCHVHFIGIGGISMSGLAEILLERGFTVSGSDARESELTKKLEAHGAKLFYGQKAENIMEGTTRNMQPQRDGPSRSLPGRSFWARS